MAVHRRSFTPEFKREAVDLVVTQGYKSKALTPEQQKIQELEARINRLEREKAILKKATALLMSDDFDRTR